MDYEALLKRAIGKIPKDMSSDSRFEMPVPIVFIQGSKTTISNFAEVASTLRREQEHLLKFLTKELATSYEKSGSKIIFQGKFQPELVKRKLDVYTKEYVLCPVCGKPDTKFVKLERITMLKCEACGSRSPVKKLAGK